MLQTYFAISSCIVCKLSCGWNIWMLGGVLARCIDVWGCVQPGWRQSKDEDFCLHLMRFDAIWRFIYRGLDMPWLYWPVSIYCPISLLILVASESIWCENGPLSALQRCCSLYIRWSFLFSLHAAPEHVLVGIMTYHTMVFRSSVYVAYAAIQDVDGLKDAVTKLMTLVQRHAGWCTSMLV